MWAYAPTDNFTSVRGGGASLLMKDTTRATSHSPPLVRNDLQHTHPPRHNKAQTQHMGWPFFKAHNSHKTNKHKHNSASLTSQFRVPFLHSSPTIPLPQPHPIPRTSSRLKCEAVLCAETPCNKYDDGYGAQAASSRNHPIRSRPSGGQKKQCQGSVKLDCVENGPLRLPLKLLD